MKQNDSTAHSPVTVVIPDPERFRGAVVTAQGEQPITDEMVLRACRALETIRYPFHELQPNLELH